MSAYNINRCPKCGGTNIAASVASWADYQDGRPHHFDEEDLPYVEPIVGQEAICRGCQHTWAIAPEKDEPQDRAAARDALLRFAGVETPPELPLAAKKEQAP